MNKLLLTANIHAGTGSVRDSLADLIDYFVSLKYEVSVHTSQHPEDLISHIGTYGANYDILVSTGGDGTLNETLNGLMRCPSPPLLCYIPAGTVNDFASSLRIPKNFSQAARLVQEGVPYACDIGHFGKRYFAYIAAFGAFTDVSYQTPQQAKQILGRFAYIVEGFKRLPTLRPYHMEIETDIQHIEDDFLFGMVTNSTSVGGFKFENKVGVAMDDGLLEVALVRMPHTLNDRQLLVNGILKQQAVPNLLDLFRTKTLKIRSEEPIPWTLDGEFGGDVQTVQIDNCHRALNILIPQKPDAISISGKPSFS